MICYVLVAYGKALRGQKKRKSNQVAVQVVKYITDMRRQVFPVARESIQIQGREIIKKLTL